MTHDETAYLLRAPANARHLLESWNRLSKDNARITP